MWERTWEEKQLPQEPWSECYLEGMGTRQHGSLGPPQDLPFPWQPGMGTARKTWRGGYRVWVALTLN